jgi:CMP-N-acetylneuraminic acid synthetase
LAAWTSSKKRKQMSGRSSVTDDGRIMAIIPARKGSKRLPGKNLLPVAGKPMIQWTIEAAFESGSVDEVLVTSDDDDVLSLARDMGVEHIVRRPRELATDEATSADVIRHANEYRAGAGLDPPSTFCLLQPTSPLRTATDVDAAIALHRASGTPVVSVCSLDHPLSWCVLVDERLGIRRLDHAVDMPVAVHRLNGAIYISSTALFAANGDFLAGKATAYVMDRNRSIDVDTIDDYLFCDLLARNRLDRA